MTSQARLVRLLTVSAVVAAIAVVVVALATWRAAETTARATCLQEAALLIDAVDDGIPDRTQHEAAQRACVGERSG